MKFLPYILKHLRHSWLRTSSTVMGMAVCIFLFCTLQTIIEAINWGLKAGTANRLMTRNAVSLVYPMPITYKDQIKGIEGVKRVAASNWFFGFLGGGAPDYKNFFANFAVDAEDYHDIHPELILTPEERQAFLADQRGAVVGPETAAKFGWKVGDAFQLTSVIYKGHPFDFVIRGIYKVDNDRYPGTDGRVMFFHWKYLYEGSDRRAQIGTFNIEINDASQAGTISKKIDALFENSEAQTKTETEAAFRASFVSMAGNLALLLNGIGLAVTFTILLVTANTMSMAVRERRTEIGVLKTLGFKSGLVMSLILVESLVLGVLGGAVGLFLGRGMIGILPSLPMIGDAVRAFPNLGLSPQVAGLGFGMAILIGLVAGFVPGVLAYRSKITESLRTV